LALENSTTPGTYPLTLKVTYTDDLQNARVLFLNGTVNFKPPVHRLANEGSNFFGFGGSSSGGGSRSGAFGSLLLIVIIAAIVVGVIIFIRRRRRRKSQTTMMSKASSDDDIESLLDRESSSYSSVQDNPANKELDKKEKDG
jgi:hypothetical protein